MMPTVKMSLNRQLLGAGLGVTCRIHIHTHILHKLRPTIHRVGVLLGTPFKRQPEASPVKLSDKLNHALPKRVVKYCLPNS